MTKINQPTPLSRWQRELLVAFSNWELSLSPYDFEIHWDVNRQQIADICRTDKSTADSWFRDLNRRTEPSPNALLRLALLDKMLREVPSPEVLHFVGIEYRHSP